MSSRLDPDLFRGAALDNALHNITGPLAAGAVVTPLTPNAAGRLVINWPSRRPLVVVSLAIPLDTQAISVDVVLDPAGAATSLPSVHFAAYSETGASLPLHAPALGKGAETIPTLTLGIQVTIHGEQGTSTAVAAANVSQYLKFELLEGNIGKLMFVLLQEKARLRRQSRELAAMKQLPGARRDALDRIGAGLGVLRFQDDLTYDVAKDEIITVIRKDGTGHAVLESDADYARRLALYQSFLLSSPARFRELLNGPGADNSPNAGLLAGLGLTARFLIGEEDNPFALAFRIVGIGSAAPRNNFLDYVRNNVLVWLPNSAAANAAHGARYLPTSTQTDINDLRQRLRSAYSYPAAAAVAPMLAKALDRLGRVLAALSYGKKLNIQKAQSNNAESRYELGLGIDLDTFSATDLNNLRTRVNNLNRAPADDAEAEALIAAARAAPPQTAAQDADGRWLLSACGFQTVHRLNSSTLYLSHLCSLGLLINGPSTVSMGASANFDAHFYPAEDPAINAALLSGLQGSLSDWIAMGHAAWTQLTPTNALAAWSTAIVQAPNALPLQVFAGSGLPAVADPSSLVTSLQNVPADMLVTVQLDTAFSNDVVLGKPSATTALTALVDSFKAHSLASAVPLITAAKKVLIVISVLGIPQIGVNLSDRRTSGFRWYTVPLGGQGTVNALGSNTVLTPDHAGAMAVVCLGYVRQGLADPYEVNIDLPQNVSITIKQYEFLMNLLEQLYPIGVGINTYAIRQNHVDLAGNGTPKPLKPAVFRTYRSFQRRRLRGIY